MSMSIKDARKDVDSPGYADAVSLSAAVSGGRRQLRIGLWGPTRGGPEGETLLCLFAMDTDVDGDDDWWVSYETESGEFIPSLFELADSCSCNSDTGSEVQTRPDWRHIDGGKFADRPLFEVAAARGRTG
jgi:hypothetical protein